MPVIAKTPAPWVVWTSELSPFGLKVILLCRYHGLRFRVLPEQGTTAERIRYSLRRELLTRGGAKRITCGEDNGFVLLL